MRALVILVLLANPLLMRAAPCAPVPIVDQTPACCGAACSCSTGCGCSVDEDDLPRPAPPAPAPAPTLGGKLLALSLPSGGLIGLLSSEPPRPPARGTPAHRPYCSCDSVNALLCIWTT